MTVVGLGRVGSVFARCARAAGREVDVVGRAGPIVGAPAIVCTRADDLEDVIARAASPADLVFVQNGLLGPFLAAHGLAGATQGVIYFAATARDGRAEPGGDSLFTGPRADEVVAILAAGGVPARAVPRAEFAREAAIKLAWNCVFGLLGDTFGEPVGASAGRPEVATLCDELGPVLDVEPRELRTRIVAYARSIPTFRASVKERRWRNGAVATLARARGLATPLHDRLLTADS
ncbi:MAG: ketopantoate reductase family protein [Myxococcota bacterium]